MIKFLVMFELVLNFEFFLVYDFLFFWDNDFFLGKLWSDCNFKMWCLFLNKGLVFINRVDEL